MILQTSKYEGNGEPMFDMPINDYQCLIQQSKYL